MSGKINKIMFVSGVNKIKNVNQQELSIYTNSTYAMIVIIMTLSVVSITSSSLVSPLLIGLNSMLDISRRVCSHDWREYFFKGAFSIFMDITDDLCHFSEQVRSLWMWIPVQPEFWRWSEEEWAEQLHHGREKRASDKATKRNVTNTSFFSDLPSKSKWENKNHIFSGCCD